MTKRFDDIVLYERWKHELTLEKVFRICKEHKNSHIIIDNSKENSIPAEFPGIPVHELTPLIAEAREWNSVHGNKITMISGNYKPWHLEVSESTLRWEDSLNEKRPYDIRMDTFGRSILTNFWDDVQLWPTYFLAWNGYKIFKHCNYNTFLGHDIPYKNIQKLFCLKINRAKPHRVLLLDELEKRHLLDHNVFSCIGTEQDLQESMQFINAQHYSRGVQTLGQDIENMNPYAAQPPMYEQTLIEIVSETYMGSYFYTEKTLWPILYRKPFLIHGAQHQNYDLQKLGFVLYDEYIDYSFDKIADHRERTAAVADELQRLNNLGLSLQNVYEMLLPKINHNLKVMLEIYHNDTHIPAVIKQYGPEIWQKQFMKSEMHHTAIDDPQDSLTWLPYFECNGRNQKAVDHIRSQPYLTDLYYRKK